MSYDLMVFDPTQAPKEKVEFLAWYQQQTKWGEDHAYNDFTVCASQLQQFYQELTLTFPDMNGSAIDEEVIEQMEEEGTDNRLTDFSLGRAVIYAAFAWSIASEAYSTMRSLASKYNVGFFDVSGADAEIVYPE